MQVSSSIRSQPQGNGEDLHMTVIVYSTAYFTRSVLAQYSNVDPWQHSDLPMRHQEISTDVYFIFWA